MDSSRSPDGAQRNPGKVHPSCDGPGFRFAPSGLRVPESLSRPQTASLATFSGDALTDLLAGLAANCIGSLVKGLMPLRASVAGLFTTDILAKPGMTNSPDSFSSL